MNDNDGLLRPTRQTEYDWGVTPRPVLFGTDIPDPRTLVEDYEMVDGNPGFRVSRGTLVSRTFAWTIIVVVIGLALYSIVWGI